MTEAPSTVAAPLTNYWISWHHYDSLGGFELNTPWWVSGSGQDGGGEFSTMCAAVQAVDEDAAKELVMKSYDKLPNEITWRFCNIRANDWVPFSDRFPKADWMPWPPPQPTPEDRLLKVEKELDKIYHAIPEWVHRGTPCASLSEKVESGFLQLQKLYLTEVSSNSQRRTEMNDFITYLCAKAEVDFMAEYWNFLVKRAEEQKKLDQKS